MTQEGYLERIISENEEYDEDYMDYMVSSYMEDQFPAHVDDEEEEEPTESIDVHHDNDMLKRQNN